MSYEGNGKPNILKRMVLYISKFYTPKLPHGHKFYAYYVFLNVYRLPHAQWFA
jgi:hypothetical protein